MVSWAGGDEAPSELNLIMLVCPKERRQGRVTCLHKDVMRMLRGGLDSAS
jgi:hypothetical protein